MLDRILEGLLQNTEQTKGYLFEQFIRDVFAVKVNLHTLLIGDLLAKTSCCRREPQKFQLRGMKLV